MLLVTPAALLSCSWNSLGFKVRATGLSCRASLRAKINAGITPGSSTLAETESETLELLEWPSFCQQVSRFCSTPMAASAAKSSSIPIGSTIHESQSLQNQTEAALRLSSPLDFRGASDLSKILELASSEELLRVSELCVVENTLACARRLKQKLAGEPSSSPLQQLLEDLDLCSELGDEIGRCLDEKREIVLDQASPKLARVRRERQLSMNKLESLLRQTARGVVRGGGASSIVVTTRRSRLCIAVKASHRSLLTGGVVLDSSNSGATLYMEPEPALALNNSEIHLAAEERAEEAEILSELTRMVAENSGKILQVLNSITLLDLACARAKHAEWLGGVKPRFSSKREVRIEQARHPLLLGASKSPGFPVPIDFKVSSGVKVVIISGPNTGGKTVALKTLGISSIMAKAGFFLPASGVPQLPWFDHIFADVGDSQSLEQSLSTFSGHIRRLRRIIELSGLETLVLIDEIGGGTDPAEGSSLATAVLKFISAKVGLCFVTTHSASLKTLPIDRGLRFENASVEFDLGTLRPTYRLLWGISGQSNALRIAESFQLDPGIIRRAEFWLSKLTPSGMKSRQSDLMAQLEKQSEEEQRFAGMAAAHLSEIQKLHEEISGEARDLGKRKVLLKRAETAAMNKRVSDARAETEEVIRRIKEDPSRSGASLRVAQDEITEIISKYTPELEKSDSPVPVLRVGERVLVRRLGRKPATVLEPADDSGNLVVQLGTVKMRVKFDELVLSSTNAPAPTPVIAGKSVKSVQKSWAPAPKEADGASRKKKVKFAPAIQTSRNTVDVRGSTVEDALLVIQRAISGKDEGSVIFIIHGIGTGALKQAILPFLQNHRRIAKFEDESFVNGGCTIAYIK